MCRAEHCPEAPSRDGAGVGEIEAALERHFERLELTDDDPRAVLVVAARMLAQGLDQRITASGMRELRACLETLRELEGGAEAERSARQAERMLRGLRELAR